MSENTDPAPQAAPEGTTAPATPAQDPAAASGEQQSPQNDGQQPTEPQEPAQPKREPWFQRRIDELTRQKRDSERREAALQAMLEAQRGGQPAQPQPGAQPATGQQPDPYQLAEQIARTQSLNEAANRTYEAGKAAHQDFDAAVAGMRQVADLSERRDFLEAVTALPNAHDVFYHLGKDLDQAAHVLSLPPVKMAIELATMSAQLGRPKPQSKAPAPISPVGASATPSSGLSDDLPMSEWLARREKQLEGRRR